MSIIAEAQPLTSASELTWIPSPLYRMSLEQYEALVESGVFSTRDRFHLINGYLVAKMTQNIAHVTAENLCGAELNRKSPARLASPAGPARPVAVSVEQARTRSVCGPGRHQRLCGPPSPARTMSP